MVVFNFAPWNVAKLFKGEAIKTTDRLPAITKFGWGAFMLYLGIDSSVIPDDFAAHHQIIIKEPLGEGNSIFLSISPEWDINRAPPGKRAITISTHTRLDQWWNLYQNDQPEYEHLKSMYVERLLDAASHLLPDLRDNLNLVLPGTPVTFKRFTQRHMGWVGGFPQTSLFNNIGPRLSNKLWIVGDSIFPGQSTAAVSLGGLRVADSVIQELGDTSPTGKRARLGYQAGIKKKSISGTNEL